MGAGTRRVRELGKWTTRQQLVLFEPDPGRRASLESRGDLPQNLATAPGETQLQDQLARHLVYAPGRRVVLLAAPQYRQRHPEVVEQALGVVDRVVAWAEMNHATTRRRVHEWLDRLVVNAPLMAKLPDVTLLTGRLSHVPAIIVGAGPSIDDSLEDLAHGAERG